MISKLEKWLHLLGLEELSGKSTLAKLLSIFEDEGFRRDDTISFEEELRKYNILSYLNKDTTIEYNSLDQYSFKFNYSNKSFNKFTPQIYISTAKRLSNKEDIEREQSLSEIINNKNIFRHILLSLFNNETFYKIFTNKVLNLNLLKTLQQKKIKT